MSISALACPRLSTVLATTAPLAAVITGLMMASAPASAQGSGDAAPVPSQAALQECAAIGSGADRLACYDKLAGRALPAPPPAEVPIATTQMAPQGAATAPAQEVRPEASPLSQYWELDAQDKRGTFNLLGYRPNYVMPLHRTNRINRTPQSPTQVAVSQPNYRDIEAKFQISLRAKAFQNVFNTGGDLWLAFTQQAMWQIWNGKDSKPFRNTDYEPEAIFVVPVPKALRQLPWGWQWRLGQFGLAHQSNGQSDPLSRSWNRVYIGTGFERGDLSLLGRFSQRLNEKLERDNNPDLVDYRGRTELQLGWTPGAHRKS